MLVNLFKTPLEFSRFISKTLLDFGKFQFIKNLPMMTGIVHACMMFFVFA